MLAHLIEEVIPGEYYTTMISLTADINILLLFLSIAKNKLYQHLKKTNFELPMVLVELLITVFTTNFTNITDVIMDMVLLDGSIAFFKVFLIFFGYIEKDLFQMSDFCKFAF